MTQAHTNPVALITAASKGIGAGIAHELASRGYKVVLLARSHEIHDFAYELGGIGIPGPRPAPKYASLRSALFWYFCIASR